MMELRMLAFSSLKADRFRTLLSLSGVAIGTFSVVSALTLVDSLKHTVKEGFEAYGSDVIYVEREPLEPDLDEDGTFKWWEYVSRPQVNWDEYRHLSAIYGKSAFAAYGSEGTGVAGEWRLLVRQSLSSGREFTYKELEQGSPVTVVGAEVDARCGDWIRVEGALCEVIGKFSKSGINTVSPVDVDRAMLIPYRAMRSSVVRSSIALADADPEKIRRIMRELRRLPPGEKDNFAINRLSGLLDEIGEILDLTARLGWIMGFFSLLVGGFGIANMMYVSVEERRRQTGICRAVGATRKDVTRQFVGEAALLSGAGGLAGIVLTAVLAATVNILSPDLALSMTGGRALTGLAIAIATGIAAGLAPARKAAIMPPREAMEKG